VFLQIEVQRKSLLHNYDIIIKRSFLGSLAKIRKGSFIWAALLSISLGLPLVLGICYKREGEVLVVARVV
jgi:predicted LPLAT superfamily acyltransferase